VPTKGTLDGEVRYKNATVSWAIVNVGGNSLLSDGNGRFNIELPTGEYEVQAGKHVGVGYAEGTAVVGVVAGGHASVIVDLQDPPEIYRRIVMRGTMQLEDYEDFDDNETATRNKAEFFDLGPWGTHAEQPWTERMGGEIRVELSLKYDLKTDLSIDVSWSAAFYEGTSENTSDLEATKSGSIKVPRDETVTLRFDIWNEDEDEPEDRADVTIDFTNEIRP
jgi:hypothetical protein